LKHVAVVRFLIVAAIVACGFFEAKLLAGAPIAGLALYTWIGVRACQRDAELLRATADQIYFTAYAFTIAGFVGLVLRVALTRRTVEQSSDLWLVAALGVFCTVLGLLTMLTIHDLVAESRAGASHATAITSDATPASPPSFRMDAYTEVVEQLIGTCKAASAAIAEVNAQVKTLKAAFSDVTQCARGTKSAGETLQRSTVELQGVLDGFVRTLTIRFDLQDEPSAPRQGDRNGRVNS